MKSIFTHIFTFVLIVLAVSVQASTQVVIETRIEEKDPFAGMKTRQVIQINFDANTVISSYETGTTNFFDIKLNSVRDNFGIDDAVFSGDQATFTAFGTTASGVMAVPDIDYKLQFVVNKSGSVTVKGCHDGYPSYRVNANGTSIYSHEHKSIDLLSLFGTCDIKIQ